MAPLRRIALIALAAFLSVDFSVPDAWPPASPARHSPASVRHQALSVPAALFLSSLAPRGRERVCAASSVGSPLRVRKPGMASSEVKTEVARSAILVAQLLGDAFGYDGEGVERIVKKLRVEVGFAAAQSFARRGLIHISLSGPIATPGASFVLARLLGSEMSHVLHFAFMDPAFWNRKKERSVIVAEVYDEAGKYLIANLVDARRARAARRILQEQAALGRYVMRALAAMNVHPDDFTGGKGRQSVVLLREVSELMTQDYPDLRGEILREALRKIARDFFLLSPKDHRPRPYQAQHLMAAAVYAELLDAVDGDAVHAASILGALADSPKADNIGDFSVAAMRLARRGAKRPASAFPTNSEAADALRKLKDSVKKASAHAIEADEPAVGTGMPMPAAAPELTASIASVVGKARAHVVSFKSVSSPHKRSSTRIRNRRVAASS